MCRTAVPFGSVITTNIAQRYPLLSPGLSVALFAGERLQVGKHNAVKAPQVIRGDDSQHASNGFLRIERR